jgi:hypothetical protein
MMRLLELLIALVLVAVLAVVVGVMLPSHRHVQHSTETNRPQPVVFDLLNGFKRFKDWSSLHNHDPKVQLNLSGPDSGKGARVDYVSGNPDIGSGSWEISEAEGGNRIVYSLQNGDYGSKKTMTITLRRTGNTKRAVEITEAYDVDYGFNLFGRYAGLYVTRSVGDDMKLTLGDLDNLLATIPNFDYTTMPIKLVDVPAENLLVAPTKAKRTDVDVQTAMDTQMKWIKQVADKNGLVATGPVRIITTDFGADSYEFDVALPVGKVGAAATPAGSAPEQLQVNLEGPVKYVQTKPGRAITANYTGYPAALPAMRNSMHAWSITHGEDVTDRPWEVYTKGIDGSFADTGEFVLYWPVTSAAKK